jgi:hypothetical protein
VLGPVKTALLAVWGVIVLLIVVRQLLGIDVQQKRKSEEEYNQ